MKPVILGKNLLSDSELIWHCQGRENYRKRPISELKQIAVQAALISSMSIIKMTRPGVFAEISAQTQKT